MLSVTIDVSIECPPNIDPGDVAYMLGRLRQYALDLAHEHEISNPNDSPLLVASEVIES